MSFEIQYAVPMARGVQVWLQSLVGPTQNHSDTISLFFHRTPQTPKLRKKGHQRMASWKQAVADQSTAVRTASQNVMSLQRRALHMLGLRADRFHRRGHRAVQESECVLHSACSCHTKSRAFSGFNINKTECHVLGGLFLGHAWAWAAMPQQKSHR